jgi:hypothetical protein
MAAAVIVAMIISPAAIRPNIPAIKAPSRINPLATRLVSEKAIIGKGQFSNDGELSPRCQGGGTLAIYLDRIVTARGSGEPEKQAIAYRCDAARQLPVCLNFRRSGGG